MATYKIRELPNLSDAELLDCCAIGQEMRSSLLKLFKHIVLQLNRIPVTTPTRVALAVLFRVAEGSLSILLLCMKNQVRDASILLTNLIELRLDLQYIALDPTRAKTWIENKNKKKKPWRVAEQLREIFTDLNEHEAEKDIYSLYSMAKHGNPVGEELSFPMAVTHDSIKLDLNNENSHWVRIHLFALGNCIHRVAQASSKIWRMQGLDVGTFDQELTKSLTTISRINEEQIKAFLLGHSIASDDSEYSDAK